MTKDEAVKRIGLLLQKMFPFDNLPERLAAEHVESIRKGREHLEKLRLDREALELGIAALMGPVSLPSAEVA